MSVESENLRDDHIVLPGRRVDITAQSQAKYIVLNGRNASIVREAEKQTTLWKSETLGVGETFELAQGETVTVFNHWGRGPVQIRALKPITTK